MIRGNKLKIGLLALALPAGGLAMMFAQTEVTLTGEGYGAYASTPTGNLAKAPFATMPAEGMSSADVASVELAGVVSVSNLDTKSLGSGDVEAANVQSVTTAESINLLGGVITAEALVSVASAVLNFGDAESSAEGSKFVGLKVNGVAISEEPAANTTIALPGIGSVILNEQVAGGDGINSASMTVNLIHVILRDALTGAQTGEIIVGSSKAAVSR